MVCTSGTGGIGSVHNQYTPTFETVIAEMRAVQSDTPRKEELVKRIAREAWGRGEQ